MILADTSVWIDHFRQANSLLSDLLVQDQVLVHPFVVGELAMGNLRNRELVLSRLSLLRPIPIVAHQDVMRLVDNYRLYGSGLGYVDAHLLAAVLATGMAELRLWTLDRRFRTAAERLGVAPERSH